MLDKTEAAIKKAHSR